MRLLQFDKQFLIDFCKVIQPYFYKKRLYSITMLLFIALCTTISVWATVAINNFNRDFFNALQAFDARTAISLTWHLLCLMIVLMFSLAYNTYFRGLLAIKWRELGTNEYIKRFLSNHNYYNLNNDVIDNPDQRISNDLDTFPTTTLLLFSLLLNSVLMLCFFGITLWQASAPITIASWNVKIPGFFCICAALYAFLGTWLTGKIGNKLSLFNYEQEKYNANFRFELIRMRELSAKIASDKGEQEQLNKTFYKVIANALAINKVKTNLSFFSNGYSQLGLVLGFIIAAPFYLHKLMDMGTLMLVSGAFSYVIGSFSIFVNVFQMLAEWRATIYRIAEMKTAFSSPLLNSIRLKTMEHIDCV